MADAKKNLRDLTEPELKKELDTLIKALYALRTRQVTDVVEKSSQFSMHRRQVARIRTEMTARANKIKSTASASALQGGATADKPKAAAPAATPAPSSAPKAGATEGKPVASKAKAPKAGKTKAAVKKPTKTPKKK